MGLQPRVKVPAAFGTGKTRGRMCHWKSSAPPSVLAFLAQLVALPLTGALVSLATWFGFGVSLSLATLVQGLSAAIIGALLGLRVWWFPIHLLFMPALLWTMSLNLAPSWFLGAFVSLFLIYWGVARTQVPLYLSSSEASRVLARILPVNPGFRVLDLGAGLGGVLADLSRRRPDGDFLGVEIAPLPFVAGWLRHRLAGGGYSLRWGNFWSHSLEPYDVVYAYLSPVPMSELWRKAMAEMRPGSLLVSNTFPIPGRIADETVQLGDFHRSRLYFYRLPFVQ